MAADTKRGAMPHTHLTDAARKLDAERQAVNQTWFSIGGADISLGSIKTALSLAGLHVVTAADKAVLEACEALSHSDLLDARDDGRPKWNRFAHAELARRGAK